MNVTGCEREFEVAEAIVSGRSPDELHAELRNHVERCAVCKDVILVADSIHKDYAGQLHSARVPPAGLVWWRAELRLRQQAVRTAERPISVVHAFGGACAVGVVLALAGSVLPWTKEWMRIWMPGWLGGLSRLPAIGLSIAGLGALLVAAPIAIYLVFSDK
jgi:hypothetical protein